MLNFIYNMLLFLNQNRKKLKIWNMHQNAGNDGAVIVSNNTKSDTCLLPGKSPTFHRVCLIECLLY
jgi:hypothetical protein